MNETETEICLTCGDIIVGWGNNPRPIAAEDPEFDGRSCCDDCNSEFVIPVRLGMPVSGSVYDEDGHPVGTFAVIPQSPRWLQ